MPSSNEEDFALCKRAGRGDQRAFAMLVMRHEAPLRSFLARLESPELADDIAQEAFLKAWRFVSSYDGRARFSTWLTRIAWRCLLDAKRRPVPSAPDAGETAKEGQEQAAQVADMLARLSQVERAALILCDGHGWSHSEAAEMLRMPLGTLKTTVARAKVKCRSMWSPQHADG